MKDVFEDNGGKVSVQVELFLAFFGFLVTNRQNTDIDDSTVAFATENSRKFSCPTHQNHK